jgi:hypothetical protein
LPFMTLINLRILPESLAFIPAYALLVAGLIALYLSAAIIVGSVD